MAHFKRINKIVILLVIQLLLNSFVYSKIPEDDVLYTVIENTNGDSINEAKAYNLLKRKYVNINPDSAILYAQMDLAVAQKTNDQKQIAESNYLIGKALELKDELGESLEFAQKALEIRSGLNDTSEIIESLTFIGDIYSKKGNYKTSVDYYAKGLELQKKLKDKKQAGVIKNKIGNAFFYWTHYDIARKYYEESLEIFEEIKFDDGSSTCLDALGTVCMELEDYENAILYYEKALEIETKANNLEAVIDLHNNIGIINSLTPNHSQALLNYQNALVHSQTINDKASTVKAYMNIGLTYEELDENIKAEQYFNNALAVLKEVEDSALEAEILYTIGHTYIFMEKSNKAIEYLLKSIDIANEIDYTRVVILCYNALSHAYMGIGDSENAKFYYRNFVTKKEAEDKRLNALKTKITTENKEKEIEILNHKWKLDEALLAKQKIEIKKQRYIIYSFIIGFVIILGFLIIILRLYRQKRKANITLAEQRDRIASHQKQIMDSIKYAQKIQEAILPSKETMNELLKEYFILYRPKDLVSGDFYWVANVNNHLIIAVADCTGHGVPGAFMSVLGISLLNEIVNKELTIEPHIILNRLREEVIKALKQRGLVGEQQDGMDMAICSINRKTNKLQYAGAKNSLYHIRNGDLSEIKADRMPVGFYPNMDVFKVRDIEIKEGDCLYMFSDGYADQFGGEKGKSLKYKTFKQLLAQHQKDSIPEQYKTITKTMDDWMGYTGSNTAPKYEQIDDMVVMGIKI